MTIRLLLLLLALLACGAGVRSILMRRGTSSGGALAASFIFVLAVLGWFIPPLLQALSSP